MFEQLGGKLGAVFDRLRGRGVITEADVDTALREVRLALLEADVALQVVKDFVAAVRLEAISALRTSHSAGVNKSQSAP